MRSASLKFWLPGPMSRYTSWWPHTKMVRWAERSQTARMGTPRRMNHPSSFWPIHPFNHLLSIHSSICLPTLPSIHHITHPSFIHPTSIFSYFRPIHPLIIHVPIIHHFTYPSIFCPSIYHPPIYSSSHPSSTYPSICHPSNTHLSSCPSVHPLIYPSTHPYLPTHPSLCLPTVLLSIHAISNCSVLDSM